MIRAQGLGRCVELGLGLGLETEKWLRSTTKSNIFQFL